MVNKRHIGTSECIRNQELNALSQRGFVELKSLHMLHLDVAVKILSGIDIVEVKGLSRRADRSFWGSPRVRDLLYGSERAFQLMWHSPVFTALQAATDLGTQEELIAFKHFTDKTPLYPYLLESFRRLAPVWKGRLHWKDAEFYADGRIYFYLDGEMISVTPQVVDAMRSMRAMGVAYAVGIDFVLDHFQTPEEVSHVERDYCGQ